MKNKIISAEARSLAQIIKGTDLANDQSRPIFLTNIAEIANNTENLDVLNLLDIFLETRLTEANLCNTIDGYKNSIENTLGHILTQKIVRFHKRMNDADAIRMIRKIRGIEDIKPTQAVLSFINENYTKLPRFFFNFRQALEMDILGGI